jgi:hypothetical protein
MSISRGNSGTLLGFDQPESVEALRTSSSLFHLLGATPLHVRLLLPEDDVPGQTQVVVLSHAFWKRMFNADPGVIGRSLTLNGFGSGAGDAKNQFTVAARPRLPDERRGCPPSRASRAWTLPAAAIWRRRGEPPRRRELQRHGAVEAWRDDGQAQSDVNMIAGRIRTRRRDKTFTIASSAPRSGRRQSAARSSAAWLVAPAAHRLCNVANLLLTRYRQAEEVASHALGAGCSASSVSC